MGSITHEEKEKFQEIKERLRVLLEYQITNFRYCFPFGRPEGSLKATLSLLERVLMKDIVTPVPPEEVRAMIKKSLETAALVNYTRLSSEAKIEGKYLLLYCLLLTPLWAVGHQFILLLVVLVFFRYCIPSDHQLNNSLS